MANGNVGDVYLVNQVRRQQTRSSRMRPGGKRPRFNLRLCGGSVLLRRNKWARLPEAKFEKFKDSLIDLMERGCLDIRVGGPFGPSIDLAAYKAKPVDVEEPTVLEEPDVQVEEEVVELEPVGEEDSESVEEVPAIPQPKKPLDRMNKRELIAYCVQVTGTDPEGLEPMVKKDILDIVRGALE